MKVLILYETKSGFTKDCAMKLHKALDGSEMFDIHKDDFNIDDYEVVLIGTPIYKTKLEPLTISYITKHKWKLLDKKLGIFCAGMNTKEFNLAVQESLPGEIFLHAEIVHCGGKIVYQSLSWVDKRTVKKRLGITSSEHLDYQHKLDELVKWAKE